MKAIGFLQISQPTAPPSPRQSLVKRRGLSLKLFMGLSEDRVPQNFVVNPHFPHENSDSRHPPSIFRQSLTESKQVSEEHLPLWDWMQKPLCQCQMEHNRIDCEDDWTWTRMAWRNGGFLTSGTWQLSKQMLQWQRQPPSRHCQMSRSPDRVLEGVNGWLWTIGFGANWVKMIEFKRGYSPKRAATNATNPIEYQIRVRIERWCCAVSKNYMP